MPFLPQGEKEEKEEKKTTPVQAFRLVPNRESNMAATPDQLAEAHALREAGFTLLSISKRTGISVTTFYRHFTADG